MRSLVPRFAILLGIVLSTTGCGEARRPVIAAEQAIRAPGDQGLTKGVLEERSTDMDQVLEAEFGEIAPTVAEEVKAQDLHMGDGTTFTSIPMAALLNDRTPKDIQEAGIESLFKRGDVLRVVPLMSENRVVASMTCSWDENEQRPAVHKWEPGGNVMFAKLIENARRQHFKESGVSLKYKGVSFYGLNRHFLYFDKDGRQFMVPLELDDDHKFFPGHEVPVSQAFGVLKAMASEQHDGPG